jgi:regulator of protease activity HflC (stomatin/prohibitin superfamily)
MSHVGLSIPYRCIKVLVALVLGLLSTACSFARVGSGEVAVVRTPNGVDKKVYPTGDWQIGVWDTPTNYTIRSQEQEEQLQVLASNGLSIRLDTSIRYHVIPAEVVALDSEFGKAYYAVIIGPTLRSQARRVVGRFQPEEIYSTQRELIERQIREGVEGAIKGRHIELEAVLIRNVTLPDSIQAAINNKLEAEQQALKMKFVIAEAEAENQKKLMQVKADADRERIQAETKANAIRVQAQAAADAERVGAQAAADAKRLDAQATADYERLVKQHLTGDILRLQEIDATKALAQSPNAKLVLLGGGGARTLLDLRGAHGADNPYP